jgi:uncharacterized protein (TIGR03435 family)
MPVMRLAFRLTVLTAAMAVAAPIGLTGQVAAPAPAFTAASIKRNVSGRQETTLDVRPGGRLFIVNHSLRQLLRIVFQVQDGQLIGGPDWLTSDRWDIVASADASVSEFQMIGMLRELLTERFRLQVHREPRAIPVYALVVADGGLRPGFRRSDNDCRVRTTCGQRQGRGEFNGTGQTLGSIRRALEQASGRIIVDRTGLPALDASQTAVLYDVTFRWRPDGIADVNTEFPSLFTAIEEQLGLRLQSERDTVDVVVIDAVDRPAED